MQTQSLLEVPSLVTEKSELNVTPDASEIVDEAVCANISAVDAVSDNGPKSWNEDEFVGVPLMKEDSDEELSFFAVYDGHGGNEASVFCRENLHQYLMDNEKFAEDPNEALCEAMRKTCEEFRSSHPDCEKVGTTAVCTLVSKDSIACGWLGDSEAWLFKNKGEAVQIMDPHQPLRHDERRRIEKDGGLVHKEPCTSKPQLKSGTIGRVNRTLAVSRSIGDGALKKWVIAEPEITNTKVDGTEQFMVLGSDGLWDVLSPAEVSSIIRKYVSKRIKRKNRGVASDGVSQAVLEKVKKRSNADNITVVVIFFKNYLPVAHVSGESSTEASSDETESDSSKNVKGPKKMLHWLLRRVRD